MLTALFLDANEIRARALLLISAGAASRGGAQCFPTGPEMQVRKAQNQCYVLGRVLINAAVAVC